MTFDDRAIAVALRDCRQSRPLLRKTSNARIELGYPLDSEARQCAQPLDFSVVIPTFNESRNVIPLLERLRKTLAGIEWEVVFVDDDSPDGTSALVRKIARTDQRVRVIQRIGRRGLSSACIEGMLATSGPYIAVMDADLQHDESILPQMS